MSESYELGITLSPYNYHMRTARKEKGFTQKDLGQLVGLSQSEIGEIELMKARPNHYLAQEIADALDLDVAVLFPPWLDQPVLRHCLQEFADIQVPLERAYLEENDDPLEAVLMREVSSHLLEALSVLTTRERKIITLRFGLDGGRPHTLGEVGREFGVTRECIRAKEQKALRRLRHPIISRPYNITA